MNDKINKSLPVYAFIAPLEQVKRFFLFLVVDSLAFSFLLLPSAASCCSEEQQP